MIRSAALLLTVLWFSGMSCTSSTQVATDVKVEQTSEGWKLVINGKPTFVQGMNWDYFPRGKTYTYNFWAKSPEFIQKALDYEMQFLKDAGVNAIRVYTGIPPEWITYINEEYDIYTMLNHSFGRYGIEIEGEWYPNTDYANPRVKEILLGEIRELGAQYRDTPGLLLYLIGNENNYGLFWEGAETEDIPMEDQKSTIRAREMYRLMNQAAIELKSVDTHRPVAVCNGDLLFLDLITEELKDIDLLGVNVYRGATFTDLYERVSREYGKPLLLTEFGSDAFNMRTMSEDQEAQAYYLRENWKDIYLNAAGLSGADNALGGFTFQFSDGWWKYDQNHNLDVHDEHASWSNGGYEFDYEEGENNMNEEWFGIMAKGPADEQGFFELHPRKAYYVLREAHRFDPYTETASTEMLNQHFSNIKIEAGD